MRAPGEGFTLVEVLVALVILALALGSCFGVLSAGTAQAERAGREQAALSLGQSTLERVGSDIPLSAGSVAGTTQDGYAWAVSIAPRGNADGRLPGTFIGFDTTITVSWQERGAQRSLSIQTLRLGSKP
jgi:general secretion pathway protein I